MAKQMRRLALISITLLAAMVWLAVPVRAQEISSFHIRTNVPGVKFRVDGRVYQTQATFLWPKQSKHIVEFFFTSETGYQYNDTISTRWVFSGWTDSGGFLQAGNDPIQTVSADRDVFSYTLNVQVEHKAFLNFFGAAPDDTAIPFACGAPSGAAQFSSGVVYVDGACYRSGGVLWLVEGPHTINAFPYPGFVFTGWKTAFNPSDAFLRQTTFNVVGGLTIAPRFVPAKRVKMRTEPMGLHVLVDRTEVPTTEIEPCEPNNYQVPLPVPLTILPPCVGDFDFEPGSTHVIGAPTSQVDRHGTTWVFDSFAHGAANHAAYAVPNEVLPAVTLTARFVRGVSTAFITQPSGLKLKINGRDNWGTTSFVYAAGTEQQIEASLEQTDSKGRKYVFKRWSNGGSAAQAVTIPADTSRTFTVIAEYELLSQLVVNATPLGADLLVDGASCAIPCRIDRPEGTEVSLSAPALKDLSDVHRLEFVSWSDNGSRERTFTLGGAEVRTLNANYRTAYRLTTTADPPEGAALMLSPASSDGFFAADTVLTVTADVKPGFKFRRYEGDASGTGSIATLIMSKPRTVMARMDRVGYIPPAGIRNAAGETPEGIVAPGSLITIFGANLAPYLEAGPSNPLTQAIAGVSVVAGNRILPLLFVSPEQINAQLPRDLAPGDYTLRVHRVGELPIEGKFTVTDSAPGLFTHHFDGQDFVLALHEDGTQVTPASPARRGERLALYGTGFGPYKSHVPEGFAAPMAPPLPLEQQVEILAGDSQPVTDWAGGAAGMVGTEVVRFRVTAEMTGNLRLRVRMGPHESNTVLLPVE